MDKLRKGRSFDSLDDLTYWFSFGSGWVYLREKRIHIGFIRCMQLQTVINFIDRNQLFKTEEV